jgi:predicted PurR-regulated permease PerM
VDKKIYLSIVAALATAVAAGLCALFAAPVAKPLAWALIIGIATLPYHERLARKFPAHPDRSAGIMVLAITICFILPFAAMAVMVFQNAADWYREGERLVRVFATTGSGTLSNVPFAGKILALGERFGIDISGLGAKLAGFASGYLLELTTNTAKYLGDLLFTLAVTLFMLFFVYRDGERIVTTAVDRFIADREKAHYYISEIRSITTAVTIGTILTCLAQGAIAGLGYLVAGVPAPALCAALTALAAIVPVVGTSIVWVPVVILVVINGAYLKAGLLALWCLFFVGLADNALRPLAIGAQSNIPVLAVVLGAICGVYAFGILGLIAGPILFAILFTVWRDITSGVHEHNAE